MKKMRHQWKKAGCILLAASLIGSSSLSVKAIDIEETKVSYTKTQVERQTDYRENSWRYEDGDRIESGILRTAEADEEYENAWTYENGHYVNSAGEPIEGALAKGVDVSTFNGEIDWETVKNETDIDYAILRCGYGNDFEDQDDAQWERNASECTRVGMPFGVYIYSYALDTEEALSEAEHVLRLVEGYDLDLPIYLDLEDEKYTGSLSNEEIADIAEVFCNKIEEAGYEVGIYANLYWFNNKLTDPCFDRWEKWIAQYNEQCDYEGEYGMWQCTSTGKVKGIEGNSGEVDLNFDYIDRGYKDIELYPVQNLVAEPAGKSRIILYWEYVSGAEGYKVYRKVEGEESFSPCGIADDTSFLDENAVDGAYNFYRVYPYFTDDDGQEVIGGSDKYVYSKPGLVPIQDISAEPYGKQKVLIHWEEIEEADGYIIYRSVGGGKFSYLYIKENTTYIDMKASDTEYNYYRVYPYYMDDDGNRVVASSIKYVYAKGLLPAVTGLKAVSNSGNVTVSWNKISDADGYIIYRQVGDTGKFQYRYMVSGTSFKDMTASKTEYNYYRVYPYHMNNGERIVNTQSIAYVYAMAK